VAEEPKKAAQPAKTRTDQDKPKIPMASPIRTDLEVFRF
jgi:hypothetical protein